MKYSSYLNNLSTLCKSATLVVIIILGLINLGLGKTDHLQLGFDPISSDSTFTIARLASGKSFLIFKLFLKLAFYAGMWSYDGWDSLNYIAEEIKNPAKTFPRVIMSAIPLVTVLYVMTNVAYLTILSPTKLANSDAVAVTFGYLFNIAESSVKSFSSKL